MNAFMEMGFNTFMDGISSGLPPEAAATAAGEVMGTAATDQAFRPRWLLTVWRLEWKPSTRQWQMDCHRCVWCSCRRSTGRGASFDAGTMEGISPETKQFNADMMDAMPPEAMAGMSALMMEAMPPEAMAA